MRKYRYPRTPLVTGTIVLQTPVQIALWEHELIGQISDGYWENASPFDHYVFWCRLEKRLDPSGPPRVETSCSYAILKHSYDFTKLYVYNEGTKIRPVHDRMICLGRLATVHAELGLGGLSYDQRIVADCMPPTLEAFLANQFTYAEPDSEAQLEFIPRARAAVSDQVAEAYYKAMKRYDARAMKRDVKVIAAAMKNVVPEASK